MKKLLVFLIAVISAGSAQSQKESNGGNSYKSAIGGRLGTTYYDIISVSFKTFVTTNGALELNGGFGARNYDYAYNSNSINANTSAISAAISYQQHFDIKPVAGLKWFVGGGAVIFNTFSDYDPYQGFGFGLFPIGGADYKFAKIPLNLSADIRPTFHVTSPDYFNSFYGNFGVAARYTFK
jgi:hypothetical protein